MVIEEDILKELRKITKIITISNGSSLEKELTKYVTTDERKKIWVLIDGQKKSEQIATEIKITKRSVDMTLQQFEIAGLIEERKYGVPPKHILDYVPSSWIEIQQKDSPSVIIPQTTKKEMERPNEGLEPNV